MRAIGKWAEILAEIRDRFVAAQNAVEPGRSRAPRTQNHPDGDHAPTLATRETPPAAAQTRSMIIGTTSRARLPIAFDARALLDDASALPPDAWEPHFNRALYRNDWSGVVLRGNGGAGLYPNPHAAQSFEDTPWLARSPGVRAVLAQLACETTSVRFLRLGANSEIFEHRDDLTQEGGEARLHVCVQTNPDVTFVLDGEPVAMEPGSCWYLDVSRPHRVVNAGASPRIHLVIDCSINGWLRELLIPRDAGDG